MTEFLTSRDEIWAEIIEAVPSGFIVTEGKYGPGRAYYKLNGDLFDALHRFFDRKEAEALRASGGASGGAADTDTSDRRNDG